MSEIEREIERVLSEIYSSSERNVYNQANDIIKAKKQLDALYLRIAEGCAPLYTFPSVSGQSLIDKTEAVNQFKQNIEKRFGGGE